MLGNQPTTTTANKSVMSSLSTPESSCPRDVKQPTHDNNSQHVSYLHCSHRTLPVPGTLSNQPTTTTANMSVMSSLSTPESSCPRDVKQPTHDNNSQHVSYLHCSHRTLPVPGTLSNQPTTTTANKPHAVSVHIGVFLSPGR